MENNLNCPITQLIFLEPVILNTGITYEFEAIVEWMKQKKTCPTTNKKIKSLSKNMLIKNIVEDYISKNKNTEQYKKTNHNLDYNNCDNFLNNKTKSSQENDRLNTGRQHENNEIYQWQLEENDRLNTGRQHENSEIYQWQLEENDRLRDPYDKNHFYIKNDNIIYDYVTYYNY
jgi:hypothetical protein